MNTLLNPSTLFTVTNLTAIGCWLFVFAGLFVPRSRAIAMAMGRLIIPVLFGLLYAWMLFSGSTQGEGSMTSLEGVKTLFQTDQLLLAGWVHYLIFDLFIGLWVLEDSLKWRAHWAAMVPILILCLVVGPIGLMLYVLLRTVIGTQPLQSPGKR